MLATDSEAERHVSIAHHTAHRRDPARGFDMLLRRLFTGSQPVISLVLSWGCTLSSRSAR
ncbi:MAG TPA: hypothetical protein DCR20_05910 [Planctomycetaceae bacterium]|nr:hypothetical protein [Planctomycetaceae bacterium]